MVTERKITPERLTFKDFMAAFRAQYRYGYPQFYDKYSITEQMVRKNNKELHGLIIRKHKALNTYIITYLFHKFNIICGVFYLHL